MKTQDMRVSGNRLNRRIAELAEFGKTPEGGVSRVAFSDEDIEGRRYAMNIMRHAGLNVRVDSVGNIFGRREGSVAGAGTILFGSHIDTVPNGGAYDGAVGSLAAIEVVHTLTGAGYRNQHPFEVVIWCDEEGGLTGSNGFVGELTEEDLARLGHDGVPLAEKIRRIGGDPARWEEAKPEPDSVKAYLELHVEQGSILDAEGIDIGVVEGFVGINLYDVTIEGAANHAGTTPMGRRQNALLTASELVLSVDRIVRSVDGVQAGTVGRLLVEPGAANVIPGRVELTVELRDLDSEKLDAVWGRIVEELDVISRKHDTAVQYGFAQSMKGALTDPGVSGLIEAVARDLGLSSKRMASGAGHDAQKLAELCPTGMIFVASAAGVSHSPAEYTRPEHVESGANVLLQTILRLDEA
jgi:N-carbamoyl-L-amino-acid hydrolase